MRISSGLCAFSVAMALSSIARADSSTPAPAPASESRPWHATLAAGGYSSLGGPVGYGTMIAVDVLPGGLAGRVGLRGEWRAYHGEREGSGHLAVLYEAGATRPKFALNLAVGVGLSHDRKPMIGVGVENSLWIIGPVGISTFADLQLIVDGLATRPALSASLALHIGR